MKCTLNQEYPFIFTTRLVSYDTQEAEFEIFFTYNNFYYNHESHEIPLFIYIEILGQSIEKTVSLIKSKNGFLLAGLRDVKICESINNYIFSKLMIKVFLQKEFGNFIYSYAEMYKKNELLISGYYTHCLKKWEKKIK